MKENFKSGFVTLIAVSYTHLPNFQGTRKGILDPSRLSLEEHNELIQKNPAYGNMICRCEMISEGEILDAIHRPLGAKSLDGIKRRTRAGMGRCQSGFCSPRTMEILSRELKVPMEELTKSGGGSKPVSYTHLDVYKRQASMYKGETRLKPRNFGDFQRYPQSAYVQYVE